ncbi:Uncharacterised protein [Bordetella pertussis]|nr:Uncharacterised protein [Bordetella pertussis]
MAVFSCAWTRASAARRLSTSAWYSAGSIW